MEKILTKELVDELGLDKLEVITSDMLKGYTSIGENAFAYCYSLISITIPDSIISIERHAFYRCDSLTSVIIPNSVSSIGYCTFAFCSSLTSIIIPNSVKNIGCGAFQGCKSLTSVTIQNTAIDIRGLAFHSCNNLKTVIIGDKTYNTQKVVNGKCKAYKAFNSDMTCCDFKYEDGETYVIDDICGFKAYLNILDLFDCYSDKLGKDIVVHEVELEGVSDRTFDNSKVAAKKIIIGKRIL